MTIELFYSEMTIVLNPETVEQLTLSLTLKKSSLNRPTSAKSVMERDRVACRASRPWSGNLIPR